jgi:hypothetical protein
MDELLTAAENEVIELRKEKSSMRQAALDELMETRRRHEARSQSLAMLLSDDLWANISSTDEYKSSVVLSKMSDLSLKHDLELVRSCFLDWCVLTSPVHVRPFCGPLLPNQERWMLMPSKIRKDEKVKSKRMDIAEYRKIKVQYVDARAAMEDANNIFTAFMKACDVDAEKAFDCLFDRMNEDMLNRM